MKKVESFKMKYDAFINGCDSMEEIHLWNKEKLGEMEAFYSNDLISIILRLIAADGRIDAREVNYLNEAFSFDYTRDELVEVYENCGENIDESFDENFENGISYMRRINPKMADSYKELLYLVCDIIVESDGIIAPEEVAQVKRLQAMCE